MENFEEKLNFTKIYKTSLERFDEQLEQADLKKLDSEINKNDEYKFLKIPYKELPEQYQNLIAQELNEPDTSSLYDLMNMTRIAFGSQNTLFSKMGNKLTGWVGIKPRKDGSVGNIKMFSFLDPNKNYVIWKDLRILLEILLFDIGYHTVSWAAVKSNEDAVKGYDLILAMYFENGNFDVNVKPIKLENQTKEFLYYTISWKEPPNFNNSKIIANCITDNYKFNVNLLSKEQKDFIKNHGIEDYLSRHQHALSQ